MAEIKEKKIIDFSIISKAQQLGQSKKITIDLNEDTAIEFHIKSLSIDLSKELDKLMPLPEPPRRFNKEDKKWVLNDTDPDYLKEKAEVESDRGILTAILGLDEDYHTIEGNTIQDKINTLKEIKMPIGIFQQLIKEITELSRINEDEFRKS